MPELDSQLLAELVDRHGAALKLYARQWCLNPDDVVQQALIDLAGSGMAPENPVAWLFAAVRRRAISRARGDRRRQRHESVAAQRWFERRRDQHEAADAAAEALAELPLEDREIVIAHVWGRLTFQEIAEIVGDFGKHRSATVRSGDKPMRERMNTPCQKPPT